MSYVVVSINLPEDLSSLTEKFTNGISNRFAVVPSNATDLFTYNSFEADKTGAATIADDLITLEDHGLLDDTIIQFSDVGTITGISASTNYYVVDATDDTFSVSATLGGVAIDLDGVDDDVVFAKRLGHNLSENTTMCLSTTGALPAGLSQDERYFVKVIDAFTFKLKSTPDSAVVNFTTDGSGTLYINNIAEDETIINKIANELLLIAANMKNNAKVSVVVRDSNPAIALSGSGSAATAFNR